MDIVKVFATNLKKYRIQKGLSQEAFAEISGLHRTYISAIEREKRSIALENIQTLIDYSGPKYEWAITPVLAKRLVSNCDTNLLMTISTFEEVAVLSVAQSRCDLRRHCLHKSLVDHSFTTDKRGNNGGCTSRKFWKQRCSEQKRLKSNGNYCKNHQKSAGKDEVGSSNPPSSSTL